MNPFFTIITVCYNSEKTIAKTLESVLNQTFQDFEYLIVDGCSTDGTLDIIKKYEPTFNGKLKCISEPDRGIYDAMNKGIKLAKGKLIGMINSDDWYELSCFEKVIENYSVDKMKVYYGLMRYYKNGEFYKVLSYNHSHLHLGMLNHPTCFVDARIYYAIGTFDLKYKLAADYDFMFRCCNAGIGFVHIESILANMAMEGASDKFTILSRRETFEILYRYKKISRLRKIIKFNEVKMKIILKKLITKKVRAEK